MLHIARRIRKSVVSGAVGSVLTLACSSSVLAGAASGAIHQVADAMGGVDRLQSVNNQLVVAKVTGFAPLQAFVPGGDPVKFDRLEYTLTRALDGSRYQTNWKLDIDFPLQTEYNFTEVINGEHGAVMGVDSILQTPQAPMQAIRLAARQLHHFVTSPVELVKEMLVEPQEVILHGRHEHKRKNVTVLEVNKYGKKILLWIDNENQLPMKATYWDSNPSLGDTKVVMHFSDWQKADGIMVPMTIKQSLS